MNFKMLSAAVVLGALRINTPVTKSSFAVCELRKTNSNKVNDDDALWPFQH